MLARAARQLVWRYLSCKGMNIITETTSNQKVLGSNPSWILSFFFRIFNNDLALMLVDSVSIIYTHVGCL